MPGACGLRYAPMLRGKCTMFEKLTEPGPEPDGQAFLFQEEGKA